MGPKLSRQSNNITNSVAQTFNDVMQQKVNARAAAACSNLQKVDGVKCCKIKFAEQTCEAIAVNDVAVRGSFDREVSQRAQQNLQQSLSTVSSGLYIGLGELSDSSNVVKNTTRIAMDLKQIFETDCTKSVVGLNEQSVKDTQCGCGDDRPEARGDDVPYDIVFAEQDLSLKAVGTCVADAVMSSKASQDLLQVMGQKSEVISKGLSMGDLLFLLLPLVLVFMVIPLVSKLVMKPVGAVTGAVGKAANAAVAQQENVSRGLARSHESKSQSVRFLLGFLGFAFVVYFITGAVLGWFPFTPKDGPLDLEVCTKNGKPVFRNQIVNRFFWYDPQCLRLENSACTEADKIAAYRGCGLMAKQGGCDDPEFLERKEAFLRMLKKCVPVQAMQTLGASSCSLGQLADQMFSAQGYGKSCRRCFSNDDALKDKNGLFSAMDPAKWNYETNQGLPECDPRTDKDLPASCYRSCADIDPGAYFAVYEGICPADAPPGTRCFATPAEFYADPARSGECGNEAYMEAKRKLATGFGACADLLAAFREEFPDFEGEPMLSQMCEPDPFQYFTKCARSNFACSYEGSSEEADRACKNDFSACEDADYQNDFRVENTAFEKCEAMLDKQKAFDWRMTFVPIAFGCFVLVMLALIVLLLRAQAKTSAELAKVSAAHRAALAQSTGSKVRSALLSGWGFIGMLLLALGVLAAGVVLIVELDKEAVGYVLVGVGAVAFLAGVLARFVSGRRAARVDLELDPLSP